MSLRQTSGLLVIHGDSADCLSLLCPTQCAPQVTPDLQEACRMRALRVGTLDMVTASVVPALLGGYTRHVSTFMSIHPAFSSAHRFLEQLLTR